MKVLIVDADRNFRDKLSERLVRRGLNVTATGNAEEGRDIACRKKFDAVLIGLSSSRETMASFLRGIKNACPGNEIILINHSGDVGLSIEAMRHGAFDEISAPVDLEELMKKLGSASSGEGSRTPNGE